MAYRRRENPITKTCKKCKASFETWHIGRIYCSQACNMTAWRHRHKNESEDNKADKTVEGNISFSLPNIATIATGSLAAKAATSLFNDEPSTTEIVDLIKNMTRNIGYSMGQVITRLKHIEDFNQAIVEKDLAINLRVKQLTKKRQLKEGL